MILVLSGTKDGREIVYKLRDKGFNLIVTTATEYGKSLYDSSSMNSSLKIISDRLDYNGMVDLINENSISLVVDATHPYADKVSQNISKVCSDIGTKYIRYQRKKSNLDEFSDIIQWVDSYEDAAEKTNNAEGNILLTTGSKTLDIFTSKISPERLYPRVLPSSSILKKCEELGFKASNIIAIQGPFTREMNVELLKKYDIDMLVTKDSGKIGGTIEKLEAAKKLNIPVIIISRPKVIEGLVFDSIDRLLDKVCEING